MGEEIDALSKNTEALIQGRRTWSVMAGAWPDRAGDPFADWMNTVQKYVVSDTLKEDEVGHWAPTTIIRGAELEKQVSALRDKPGGAVNVMGSSAVARSLLAADLVDELALMLEPITLGGGKSIYPTDGEARTFELTSVKQAGTGVLICRYERAR